MAEKREPQDATDLPEGMTRLFIGLLKKGPTWTAEATPGVMENQRRHLELLTRLGREGTLLLAGPTPDGGELRGIVVVKAESKAEAEALFAEDPHLASDRLELDVHPWLVPSDRLSSVLASDDPRS